MPYLGHPPDFYRALTRDEKLAQRLLEQDLEKPECLGPPHSALHDEPFINRLPVEVLGDIFLLCKVHNNQHCYPFADTFSNQSRAPMLLVQVCRFWRDICFSMAALWSSMTVGCLSAKPTGDILLEQWLLRSQKALLQINAAARPGVLLPHRASVLASHSRRWQVICMTATDALMQNFLSLPPSATPHLDGFSLQGTDVKELVGVSDGIAVKLAAIPSLRQLHFAIRGRLSFDNHFFGISFERLSHLKLEAGHLRMYDCIDILRHSLQAVQVSFRCIEKSISTDPPLTYDGVKICLPNLLSLTISTYESSSALLRHFACPALRRLYIDDNHHFLRGVLDDGDLTVFDDFLSQNDLEQLIIFDEKASWERARRILMLESVRKIPNAAVRVIYPFHPHTIAAGEFRCPVANCRAPHIGWHSSKPLEHVDAPLPPLNTAFWDSPYRHETSRWIPIVGNDTREDFLDE